MTVLFRRGEKLRLGLAFTLIELLVAIAVIAVLAALLVSSISQAKAKALCVVCKNNLHEMGLALKMYADDNRGRFAYYFCQGSLGFGTKWEDSLAQYSPLEWTNSRYQCPCYQGAITSTAVESWANSYAYNCWGSSPGFFNPRIIPLNPVPVYGFGISPFGPPVLETQLAAPSEMIAITDSAASAVPGRAVPVVVMGPGGGPFIGDDNNACWPTINTEDPFDHIIQQPPQHGRNFNVLFCDGHVVQMKVVDLMQCSNSAALWNYDHRPHPEGWIQALWPSY